MQNETTIARTTLQRTDDIEAKVDNMFLAIRNDSSLEEETEDVQRSEPSQLS